MKTWKEEVKLIDNLGLLYLGLNSWVDYNKNWINYIKAWWVYELCVFHLDQRMPQLEKFIKKNNTYIWSFYKEHFKIND